MTSIPPAKALTAYNKQYTKSPTFSVSPTPVSPRFKSLKPAVAPPTNAWSSNELLKAVNPSNEAQEAQKVDVDDIRIVEKHHSNNSSSIRTPRKMKRSSRPKSKVSREVNIFLDQIEAIEAHKENLEDIIKQGPVKDPSEYQQGIVGEIPETPPDSPSTFAEFQRFPPQNHRLRDGRPSPTHAPELQSSLEYHEQYPVYPHSYPYPYPYANSYNQGLVYQAPTSTPMMLPQTPSPMILPVPGLNPYYEAHPSAMFPMSLVMNPYPTMGQLPRPMYPSSHYIPPGQVYHFADYYEHPINQSASSVGPHQHLYPDPAPKAQSTASGENTKEVPILSQLVELNLNTAAPNQAKPSSRTEPSKQPLDAPKTPEKPLVPPENQPEVADRFLLEEKTKSQNAQDSNPTTSAITPKFPTKKSKPKHTKNRRSPGSVVESSRRDPNSKSLPKAFFKIESREPKKNEQAFRMYLQLDYYFSKENLFKDFKLRAMMSPKDGGIDILTLLNHRRFAHEKRDDDYIDRFYEALKPITHLELIRDDTWVRLKNWKRWLL